MSTRKLVVRPQARLDLLDIWHFIAKDSPPSATRVIDAIERAIRQLQSMPGMGHRRADVRDPRYRFWTVHRYVVAFRFDDTTLTVVRVVHGARDLRETLPRPPH